MARLLCCLSALAPLGLALAGCIRDGAPLVTSTGAAIAAPYPVYPSMYPVVPRSGITCMTQDLGTIVRTTCR